MIVQMRVRSRVVQKVGGEWSAIQSTRLETRTKESSMCASRWIIRNPKGAMKVKVGLVID